ncbi:MAG TPA: type II secretion system F family protein [Nocardioidaceae bacterium]
MSVLAAVGVGLTVWLLLPGRRPLPVSLTTLTVDDPAGWLHRRVPRGRALVPLLAVGFTAGLLVALVEGTLLALALIVVGALVGAWRMTVRARARKAADERADSVVEACDALAGELRAGQPPLLALRHCVDVCALLERAAAAGELGGSVPEALRRLSREPGAGGLVDLAAAWQVSEGSGGTMAVALGRVADSTRARRATQRLVASELASAQATARLVAALPVMVLLMGSGLGGDPWGFLFATPLGLACLSAGLLLVYLGLAWIERIAVAVVES